MKYILNEQLALRSYNDSKYALLISQRADVIKLRKSQFDILLKCDGKTELQENTPEFSSFLSQDIIREAKNNECLTDWQKHHFCDNPFKEGLDLRITGRCNCNCKHCFNAADMNLDTNQWSMEEINKLLDEAVECGIQYVKLTGGEPMLHPDFMEIIGQIYKRKMAVRDILTNAYFITQNILDELKEIGCNPRFYISFDCLGHHDWMRGQEGSEKKALEAIKLCIDNGFKVLLHVQLNRVTQDTLLETALYFDSIGVDAFRILRTSESPRWTKYAGDACLPLPDYFDTCMNFIKHYSEKPHHMQIICWGFCNLNPVKKNYRFTAIRCKACTYRDILPVCGQRLSYVYIGSDGELYPCHQVSGIYDSMGWKLPNVKTGLQKAINDSAYLRDSNVTTGDIVKENEKCKSCSHFKQCFGGCRTMSLALGNGKYGPDPFMCTFYEGNYEQKMKEIIPDWTLDFPSEDATYIEGDINNLIRFD